MHGFNWGECESIKETFGWMLPPGSVLGYRPRTFWCQGKIMTTWYGGRGREMEQKLRSVPTAAHQEPLDPPTEQE